MDSVKKIWQGLISFCSFSNIQVYKSRSLSYQPFHPPSTQFGVRCVDSAHSYHVTSSIVSHRLLGNSGIVMQQSRTRVYQSWKKGKPETVREVPSRFMRLGNGLWIRPRAGRRKGLWKRKPETLEDLKQHVICSKRQCWMLERMVGKYWKRDHHYPNDPYAPYHVRNGFNNDIVYKPNRPPFYP